MITCNLDRLVFAFKQRSSDRSAAHRWNKTKNERKEMKRAMLRTKWNECREWDLMIFFLLHKKNHFNVVLMIDMARLKRWRRRWSLDENVCISLSLSISLTNLFHDKWLFLIDLALCLIITRCTIENFPLLLLLADLFENFFSTLCVIKKFFLYRFDHSVETFFFINSFFETI